LKPINEDKAEILIEEPYDDLDYNALLKPVYAKYFVYARKTKLRRLGKSSDTGGLQ